MTTATLFLALGLTACGDKDDTGAYSEILALTGDATSGETLFANNCAACHGADGSSGTAADLAEHVPLHSDEELVTVMLEGFGSMPAVALEDQEAADILAWLKATF